MYSKYMLQRKKLHEANFVLFGISIRLAESSADVFLRPRSDVGQNILPTVTQLTNTMQIRRHTDIEIKTSSACQTLKLGPIWTVSPQKMRESEIFCLINFPTSVECGRNFLNQFWNLIYARGTRIGEILKVIHKKIL